MVSNHSQGHSSRKLYQVDAEVCQNIDANTSNRDSEQLAETVNLGRGETFPRTSARNE